MKTTRIYKSYEDFLERKDQDENGVSENFAAEHPDFEEQNEINTGCWNCKSCKSCEYCAACESRESYEFCDDCEFCKSCANLATL